MEEVQAEMDQGLEPDAQLYEVIGDSEMGTTVQVAAPRVAVTPAVTEYDDVVPGGEASKAGDPYQITQCSAYGISLNQSN